MGKFETSLVTSSCHPRVSPYAWLSLPYTHTAVPLLRVRVESNNSLLARGSSCLVHAPALPALAASNLFLLYVEFSVLSFFLLPPIVVAAIFASWRTRAFVSRAKTEREHNGFARMHAAAAAAATAWMEENTEMRFASRVRAPVGAVAAAAHSALQTLGGHTAARPFANPGDLLRQKGSAKEQ